MVSPPTLQRHEFAKSFHATFLYPTARLPPLFDAIVVCRCSGDYRWVVCCTKKKEHTYRGHHLRCPSQSHQRSARVRTRLTTVTCISCRSLKRQLLYLYVDARSPSPRVHRLTIMRHKVQGHHRSLTPFREDPRHRPTWGGCPPHHNHTRESLPGRPTTTAPRTIQYMQWDASLNPPPSRPTFPRFSPETLPKCTGKGRLAALGALVLVLALLLMPRAMAETRLPPT